MTRNKARVVIGIAMVAIAAIAAVISYVDGLYVARLAGNHGWIGYLYPLLPDGLIVVCLAALYEAAQRKLSRPRWATAGLVLGVSLTLAQNTGAGAAHGALDALMDGMVPVVFFVAVEVLIWHVRAGRHVAKSLSVTPPPTDAESAAVAAYLASVQGGNPLSGRQLESRFGLTRAEATKVRASVNGSAPDVA